MKVNLSTKQKTIIIFATVALIVIAIIGFATASSFWTATRTHTQPTSSFTVDKPTDLNYGVTSGAQETFTVTNTGNIPITITASASGAGGTYSWDKTSALIQPGQTASFTLTSTFTADGTVTVTFTSS